MRQMKRLLILLLCLLLLCLPVAAAGEEETSASRLEAELDVPEQQKDLSLLQDGRISTYVDFKAGNRLLARVKEPPQGVAAAAGRGGPCLVGRGGKYSFP